MSHVLRLAVAALVGSWLGCARPPPSADDAGRLASAPAASPSAQGTIEGRVVWHGVAPTPQGLPTSASVQSVCGTSVTDNGFRLDTSGGVAEVVVWVDAPPEVGPSANPVLLDQRGCLYWPAVFAARTGASLRIRNSDPLTHTVHARSDGVTVFDVAMPLEHMELSRQLPGQPGLLELRCDVHPWMQAVVRTFDHSHFTTTGLDGRFHLAGLAPGDYALHAWHPRLGEASRRLHLADAVVVSDFEFGGKP